MKNDLFTIVIDDQTYTSDAFRALCKYHDVVLSIYSDGMLDSLVSLWNTIMPISKSAKLLFDGEESKGFKRKISFASNDDTNADGWCADPRNSKGKY